MIKFASTPKQAASTQLLSTQASFHDEGCQTDLTQTVSVGTQTGNPKDGLSPHTVGQGYTEDPNPEA